MTGSHFVRNRLLDTQFCPQNLIFVGLVLLGFGFVSSRQASNQAIGAEPAASVDFSSQIRPMMSDLCFHCHGPDEEDRQADLRLDVPESATEDRGGYAAVVAGDLEASELMQRILSDDEDLKMPPPDSGKQLSGADIELFRRWIEQGAPFEEHWAFQPPKKTDPPDVEFGETDQQDQANHEPSLTAIDRFVRFELQDSPLSASPKADRQTLIRRLSLDLIGLPPSPSEVKAFADDTSEDAYEKVVQRLLSSQHHGEHWARMWLDAARYADSDGFEKDKPRFVHAYRDWVVRSLNEDLPYDEFVIKQVAGDLLPGATPDDHIATGFLRNSMINEEGGADVEQFRMEAMYDRVDAIGKSVLGLTVQCAQCHSHKYDPISHTDYYALFAMLNNCDEACMTVYDANETAKRDEVSQKLAALREQIDKEQPELADQIGDWIESVWTAPEVRWVTPKLDYIETTIGGQKYAEQEDGSYLAQGYAPTNASPQADGNVELDRVTAVRVEVLRDPNLPHGGPGRSIDGTWAISEFKLYGSRDSGESWNEIKLAKTFATINPPKRRLIDRYFAKKPNPKRVTGGAAFLIDGNNDTAWTGTLSAGRRNDPQVAYVSLAEPFVANDDDSIMLRFELTQKHGGWNSDDNQSHNAGRTRFSVTDDDRALDNGATIADRLPPALRDSVDEVQSDWDTLTDHRIAAFVDHYIQITPELKNIRQQQDEIWSNYPEGTSQLVLAERSKPRMTHRLNRGDFLSPAERVEPGFPDFLHDPSNSSSHNIEVSVDDQPSQILTSVPNSDSANRLDLAYWLVDRNSPTAARSIVNRVWQSYFGIGLVSTPDDFGMQGAPPTHPELLDWLAVDFIENGWSLKHLHRTIVSSATYQQSSNVRPKQLEIDPQNRLLSRGPRFRVSAEVVRDIALSASGLLNPEIGGEPVFPPAPGFLFTPPASYGPKTWAYDEGKDKYRRALYTFRFRSVPYPAFQAFDAPTGEVSCVRRNLSNTPLQALVTLNEPLFVECAQTLGRIAMQASEQDDRGKIESIFIRCLGRRPTDQESNILEAMLDKQRKRMSNEPEVAIKLTGSNEDRNRYETNEHAAWTTIARVVLNLDETITKR